MKSEAPLRTLVADDVWYAKLDPGIRFAVRVLHAAGVETCECCEGGEGHAFDRATIDLPAGETAEGFKALSALASYNLPVRDVSIVWLVANGLPTERRWRITFSASALERADEQPIFVHGYIAQEST